MSAANWATVKQASPLLIREDGASTNVPAKHLAAYTPALNDRVAYVLLGQTILVLGKPT